MRALLFRCILLVEIAPIMKPRHLKIALLIAIVALLALNAYLFQQNNQYRHQNRALILQNDSILSANLELLHNSNLRSTVQLED